VRALGKSSFRTPTSFGLSHERRQRLYPQENGLGLEVVAQVLAGVVMPEAQPPGGGFRTTLM